MLDVAARQGRGTRAKDADRSATCALLDTALSDGQLDLAEHRQRIAAATNAVTLGELDELTADLQVAGSPRTPQAPRRGARWKKQLAIVAATVAVLGGIIWIVAADDESPPAAGGTDHEIEASVAPETTVPPSTEDVAPIVIDLPRELHTLDGMTALLDEIRKRFGDTIGYELAVFPDDAYLYRVDPADERNKLLYRYDAGWDDPDPKPRSDDDFVGDLAAFNVSAAVAALNAAPGTLGVDPANVSQIVIDIDEMATAPDAPSELELLIKVTDRTRGSGFIYLDGAGNTKRVSYPG